MKRERDRERERGGKEGSQSELDMITALAEKRKMVKRYYYPCPSSQITRFKFLYHQPLRILLTHPHHQWEFLHYSQQKRLQICKISFKKYRIQSIAKLY